MLQAHSQQRPDLQFVQMDVLKMEFEDAKFSVVLDKGTLDALMSDDSSESIDRIDKMFNVSFLNFSFMSNFLKSSFISFIPNYFRKLKGF